MRSVVYFFKIKNLVKSSKLITGRLRYFSIENVQFLSEWHYVYHTLCYKGNVLLQVWFFVASFDAKRILIEPKNLNCIENITMYRTLEKKYSK